MDRGDFIKKLTHCVFCQINGIIPSRDDQNLAVLINPRHRQHQYPWDWWHRMNGVATIVAAEDYHKGCSS
ncbi:hypothetical protein [Niveispirillum lacus]|uniref:hypothetical protein n=1 Tax=Niveispirillum lacus TaxID=1981099 RepID=UPI0010541C8A|nr:hypothetical protein [Niveispirillum lacus]